MRLIMQCIMRKGMHNVVMHGVMTLCIMRLRITQKQRDFHEHAPCTRAEHGMASTSGFGLMRSTREAVRGRVWTCMAVERNEGLGRGGGDHEARDRVLADEAGACAYRL